MGDPRWRSRPIDDASTHPRMVIARALARYARHDDIPPMIWAEAGAVEKELRAAGQLVDRRRKAKSDA